MSKLAFLSALALLSVACLGSDFEDSIEGSWQLTSGRVDGEEIPLLDTHPITAVFESDRVSGNASCNQYFGDYTLSGSSLSFEPLASTEMACFPEDLMQAEMMYLDALGRAEQLVLDEGLVLRGSGVELVFDALEPVPGAELTNTVWVLDGLISGDTVSSVLGERATLEIFSDGSMLGSTGCRTFSGTYELDGAEVLVAELVTADIACEPDVADQDAHVLEVLGEGFTAEIDGDTLTSSGPSDLGLVYHAEG